MKVLTEAVETSLVEQYHVALTSFEAGIVASIKAELTRIGKAVEVGYLDINYFRSRGRHLSIESMELDEDGDVMLTGFNGETLETLYLELLVDDPISTRDLIIILEELSDYKA